MTIRVKKKKKEIPIFTMEVLTSSLGSALNKHREINEQKQQPLVYPAMVARFVFPGASPSIRSKATHLKPGSRT